MDCENSEMAYYTNCRKRAQCNHNGKHECSLGLGAAVAEKGKKRGQIEKVSASEASRAVTWGGEKGGVTPSPRFFAIGPFFSFFPQCGAWSQASMNADYVL